MSVFCQHLPPLPSRIKTSKMVTQKIHLSAILLMLFVRVSQAATLQSTPPATPFKPAGHMLPTDKRWTFAEAPPFCTPMIARPRPATSACHRNRTTMRCQDGSFQMFSQMSQDFYLYTKHFAFLKRRGLYLDVATNDPIGISNTYFFEKCLGWDGLCVEANPHYLAGIHRLRSCALVPTCVSDKDGASVRFALRSGLSGVLATNKNAKAWNQRGDIVPTVKQQCSTMKSELRRYGVTRADYLSLDVEGHELHVLKGFDWSNVVVNVITVESTNDNLPGIEQFLLSKEYKRHTPTLDAQTLRTAKLHEDAVFLYKDVTFGKPV